MKSLNYKLIAEFMDPKNWQEKTLDKVGMSQNAYNFEIGDKIKWMPSFEQVNNNSKLKNRNMFGLFKRYNAFVKSINDDGSITIEVEGIGDNNLFKITDLLTINHIRF